MNIHSEDERLNECLAEFKALCDEWHPRGMNVLVLAGSYDPVGDHDYSNYTAAGSFIACEGLLAMYFRDGLTAPTES